MLYILFYKPPCGKWYVHSHKLYDDPDAAREAARKFLPKGTRIAIERVQVALLYPEFVA